MPDGAVTEVRSSHEVSRAEEVRVTAAKQLGLNLRVTWRELDDEARARGESGSFNYDHWRLTMEDATQFEMAQLIQMRNRL